MVTEVFYLGPPGSFGEQAAIKFLQQTGITAERHPLPSHTEVIKAVDGGDDDFGVVPVENSLEGTVVETMDAILTAHNVFVCGELAVPVEHHLITAPDTRLEDVSVVMSHPQALGQCRAFLQSRLPSARLDAALSTAGAVEEAVRTPGAAAIGARRAAELHGGVILAEAIQDLANNKTRFQVLALHDAPRSGDDKTSIAFTVADRPGAVVGVMKEFSERGINLTRIESRPSRDELGKYVFLIDFQAHRLEEAAREALAAIERNGAVLLPAGRPLGSYPRYTGG
jgi:prephenate dehydratase